ncbi:hypothetical protein GCM10010191_42040 [Actinomadura vinacea]|uniref:Glycosyltransferase RgtA/B/C/D-like domain-containing protein n=1 Tax=Actinomadura vinacea TaxID=115336 RepID=A0ABN3J9R0_9ACTN
MSLMLPAISAPRPSAPPAPPVRRPSRALPWLLLTGWLAQVAVRLWLSRTRTGPAANPDESSYLAVARWLAGGAGGDLSGHTFYQPGYPLLLAPVSGLDLAPATVYALVMAVNALVGALAFPLGYAALRRLRVGTREALPLAWAAALLPAVTFFGAFALADAVLPVVVLGWLLLLDRFARSGGPYAAAGASLVAVYAYAVHSRGLVLMCVHGAALAFIAFRREERREWAVLGLAAAAIGYAGAAALNDSARAAFYPAGARDLAGLLTGRLTSVDGWLWALSGAAGQIWYLVVATWGLGGVGLAAVAGALVRRRTDAGLRVTAGALLAGTFGIAYASSAALPDEHRVGNFAYGRYLACVALVYTLAGLAVLARGGLRRTLRQVAGAAAVTAVCGLWVALYAGERLRTHQYIRFDFPETEFLAADRTGLHLLTASAAALGLLAAFTLLGRLRHPVLLAVLAVLLLCVNLAALKYTGL